MAKEKVLLTVALAVYNEEKNIERCLSSIKHISDEIVIVDGGSTDQTVALAKKFGATIIRTDNLKMFHTNKQKALDASHGEWILQLDADEVVGQNLSQEILGKIHDKNSFDGYYIPRKNYFLGHWMRKGGQYPDAVIRLFRNGKGSFPQKSVHEQITIQGTIGTLSNALDHYSYESIQQYWKKSQTYIQLTAEELTAKKNRGSVSVFFHYVLIKPLWIFFLLFIRHKGFVDGWYGFLFALFSALHYPKAYRLSLNSR